jgi:hypothetical protein
VLIDDLPIGAALNRNLGSPTAPGEAVESELDRLIESALSTEGPRRGKRVVARECEALRGEAPTDGTP